MAPSKKSSSSPMKTSPKPVSPNAKIKAYKEYYVTLDVDTLKKMCKDQGLDSAGTKADLVDRLSQPKPKGTRARSGSPFRSQYLPGHDFFSNMTKTHEWTLFFTVALVMLAGVLFALLFHSTGGDFHKFLDFFGVVGDKVKGLLGGAAKKAAAVKK